MRRAWVAALLVIGTTAHAEPQRAVAAVAREHRVVHGDVALKLSFELPAKRPTKPLSQRRILKTRGDGPPALVTRSSDNRWFVGAPGVQRLTKLMAPQSGLTVTLFGAKF
jgi:hypothetical protein